MQKHRTSRLFRLADLSSEQLVFKLTPEQRERVPKGTKLAFYKCTRPHKEKGYKQLLTRAEFCINDPVTGKRYKRVAGAQLIGIIWDDDPEWVYETDKTKSSIKERRQQACKKKHAPSRYISQVMSILFEETIGFENAAVIVKKVPIEIFLVVTLICSFRGTTDATSAANYWNKNIPFLRKVHPELEFNEISHDSVTRIFSSLTEEALQQMLSVVYQWSQGMTPSESEQRHFAIDGQTCRSSCRYPEFYSVKEGEAYDCVGRPMMILNAVDVTNGNLCASHSMISTKSSEQKFAPKLIKQFNINGATVTLDALNTTVDIAQSIISGGGFYLLPVKENHPKFLREIKNIAAISEKIEINMAKEQAHDREDIRRYTVVPANGLPEEILQKWPGLREGCIVKAVTRTSRRTKGRAWESSEETRWFISSHPYGDGSIAPWLAECIRGHWGVESFHWVMDMIWKQDMMQCQHPTYLRARESLAKMAFNLVKAFQRIDQQERGLSRPRSLTQLTHEVGASVETGLFWLQKLVFCKDPTSLVR